MLPVPPTCTFLAPPLACSWMTPMRPPPLRHGCRVGASLSGVVDDGGGTNSPEDEMAGGAGVMRGGGQESWRADGDDVDVDVDVGDVTDEEVLLACRAYLSRTHRLEWTERERRREGAASVAAARATPVWAGDGTDGVGHFWDDPDELPYLFRGDAGRGLDAGKGLDLGDDDDDYSADVEEEEGDYEEAEDDDEGEDGDEDTLASDWDDSPFSGYPQRAPKEHSLRSIAAKKTWSDPEWKARWYAKRWGSKSGSGRRRANDDSFSGAVGRGDSRMRAKMSSLPPDVLRSPELASLGEEELSDVIRTYVVANRRRSRTRKLVARDPMRWRVDGINKAAGGGRDDEDAATTPSFEPSEDALREAQRKRSERAARAYRTRLANLAKKKEEGGNGRGEGRTTEHNAKEPRKTAVSAVRRSRTSPHQEAIRRIEAALEGGEDPSRPDVELILEPERLGRRREVLLRILRERFGLTGRCVPPSPDDEDFAPKLFASRCPIGLLGDFVLELLDGRNAEQRGK